ncbi:MAG: ribosome small subunit-dependent GTPase A [Bacillota bacterium]|nr:ribosome small subunit-dependent GTPase A [Bacillota bacterium]
MDLTIKNLGLQDRFAQEASLYGGLFLARIVSQSKDLYRAVTEKGEVFAQVSGKLRYEAQDLSDFPAVGDFVMLDRECGESGNAVILHVLRRKTVFERKAAGTALDVQVVAANIDVVFICMSLNNDFNLRRLERYISIAWDSRALPVVILTKSDLCADSEDKISKVLCSAPGVDVLTVSALTADGLEPLKSYMKPGATIAFIGSSGVGKSTIINHLSGGEVVTTGEIGSNDKGRHTTTQRQLLLLPGGCIVIDTPGMRELGVESADLGKAFTDIETLSAKCRFKDCSHQSEPGCAVKAAIEAGNLSEERLGNYLKLKKEVKYDRLNSRQIENEKINSMFSGKNEMKKMRKIAKDKNNRRHY